MKTNSKNNLAILTKILNSLKGKGGYICNYENRDSKLHIEVDAPERIFASRVPEEPPEIKEQYKRKAQIAKEAISNALKVEAYRWEDGGNSFSANYDILLIDNVEIKIYKSTPFFTEVVLRDIGDVLNAGMYYGSDYDREIAGQPSREDVPPDKSILLDLAVKNLGISKKDIIF